jgi:hypothetical protein
MFFATAFDDFGLFLLGLDTVGSSILWCAGSIAVVAFIVAFCTLSVSALQRNDAGLPWPRLLLSVARTTRYAILAGALLGAFVGAAKGLLSSAL